MVKNEWKNLLKNPILIIVLAAIILIPSIYAGFFLASMWDPYGELDKLPVAVVNLDQGTTYDGRDIRIGDELVSNLEEDGSLNFSFVSEDEAQQGLVSGKYYMTVTIPEDFSAKAVTAADADPQRMDLIYKTNPATNYIAMKLSESAMTKIELSLQQKISEEYTEVIFEKFGDLSQGLHDACDGADQLLEGEDRLTDGVTALNDGATELSDGTSALNSGARTLGGGIRDYIDGASQVNGGIKELDQALLRLSSGASDLDRGANTLASGTSQALSGADNLARGAAGLSSGADDLATGSSSLASGAATLQSGLSDLTDGLDTLNSNAPALTAGVASIDQGAGDLKNGIATYTSGVSSAYQGASSLATGISTLSDSTSALETGSAEINANIEAIDQFAQQMAQSGDPYWTQMAAYTSALASGYASINGGISAINSNMPALTEGSDQLAAGLNELNNAGSSLNNGISQLQSGSSALNAAMPQFADGIENCASGSHALLNGANTLTSGADSVASGADQLASGASALEQGADSLRGGISSIDEGAAALADGASRLDNGLSQTSDGAEQIASGSQTLVSNNQALTDGVDSLIDGADRLDNGSHELADGTGDLVDAMPELSDGTTELRDGLASGASRIDSKSLEDINAEMISNPVDTEETRITEVADNGHAMAAYMMSVGLWVACLAFCLMYPLTKHDELKSGFAWWLSKASVLYPMSIIQAVILVLILHINLGFDPVRFSGTVLVACLASMAFMSLMYLFNVLLGKVGSFIMLIFMVLQLAGSAGTYPLELSGPLAQALNRFMPFTYTVTAFRSTIGGGEDCSKCVIVLLSILVISTLLTILLFNLRGKEEKLGKRSLYDILEEKGFA